MANQTIELDCAPGFPRPGDLIEGVLKNTGIEPVETCSRLMGNWIWDFNDVDQELWDKANPTIQKRVKALYHEGSIRYGSW